MLKGSDVPRSCQLTFANGRGRSRPPHRVRLASGDPQQVDRYIADPRGFDLPFALAGSFEMTFRASDLRLRLRKTSRSICERRQDPATEQRKRYRLANHSNATASQYHDRDLPDMRHETLNEIGADVAISSFAD